MGGAASIPAEKAGPFNETEVKELLGTVPFDQAKFDSAKAEDGTVTLNQLQAVLAEAAKPAEGGEAQAAEAAGEKAATVTLKTVVFMGSARDIVPPWGGEARAGDRVLKHVLASLKARRTELGDDVVAHEVTVFDPKEVFAPGGALEGDAQLATPHFMMKPGTKPKMDEMQATIAAADAFVIVTCEYNHSPPPALTSMMGHFRPGAPNWDMKPSGIVSYSAGGPAGKLAAIGLRPFLSELGCLSVKKLCPFHVPKELFDEGGQALDPKNRHVVLLPLMLTDLEWTALAMKRMKASHGPPPAPNTRDARGSVQVAQGS